MVYDYDYQKRWAATEAGKESRRRSSAKYDKSPKGTEYRKSYYAAGKASKTRKKYIKTYRGMLHGVLRRAETRHRERWPDDPLILTHAQVIDLWRKQNGRCVLSGIEMTWGQGSTKATSVSVDRIDSKRGYHLDNIRLICTAINAFRGNGTDAEMVLMAMTIVAYAKNSTAAIAA